ncbi:MAG TPA: hypothetical protein VM186_11975 [Planctomycetota bacterium]|nr:hypothetical protein [Planctomycetota bacterium]
MQRGNRHPGSAGKLVEVRAKMASGFYSAQGVALKTAEMILKNHPRMFDGGRNSDGRSQKSDGRRQKPEVS